MGRPRNDVPNLKWCNSSGQWVCYVGRKRVRLGADRIDAERKRLSLISGVPDSTPHGPLILSEALELYSQHVKTKNYYPGHMRRIKYALLEAVNQCGAMPAEQFRAKALRIVQRSLVNRETLCRRYINHLIQEIKTAVGWLVSEELLPADSLASVRSVRALEPGDAKDYDPIGPADPDDVERTIPYLSPTLAAMVRVQLLTGMRPGELCRMRRCEVSINEGVKLQSQGRTIAAVTVEGVPIWLYVPSRHKNSHRGKSRIIPIGPEAQSILAPFLLASEPDAYLFRPRGSRAPGPHYQPTSYAAAIRRAIERARKKGIAVKDFSPYSLRHTLATVAAEKLDSETAGLLLGHSAGSRVIGTYVEDSILRAASAAKKIG